MRKVLIFGSSGFLGKKVFNFLKKKKYKIYRDSSIKKKIKKNSNHKFLLKIIDRIKPDIIINLIALTNVDQCEVKKKLAQKSNTLFVKNLVTAIKISSKDIYLVHISTDQVYSGRGNHRENIASPVNYYGISKLKGEKFASQTFSTVFRTNFIGKGEKTKKATLSDWIIFNLKKGKKINTFKNIYFSPLHTSTLTKIIEQSMIKKIRGTFNLGSSTKISKAKFAEILGKYLGYNTNFLNKVNYSRSNLLAKRPLDMSLKVKKFEKKFEMKLPSVKTEIGKLSKEYK